MCPRRESYGSITSWVLNVIGTKFIVRRNDIYPEELEYCSDPKKRRNMLNTVRYVVQALRSKSLIYLVPRRFIINVPLVLIYYRLNNDSLNMVCETALKKGFYLSHSEARSVAVRIVNDYLPRYKTFVDTLLKVGYLFFKIVSYVGWDEVVGIVYSYIPHIVSGEGARPSDVVEDIRAHIVSHASREELEKFRYAWRTVLDSVDTICFDNDPHVESICHRFMDRVLRYTLGVLYPSHYESSTMFTVKNLREEVILRVIQYFGSISEEDLVKTLYLLKEKGIDLGYLFISVGGKLVTTQVFDDVENLLSRELLERDIESNKLKLTVFGQKALSQRKPSKKVRNIMKAVEDIAKTIQ